MRKSLLAAILAASALLPASAIAQERGERSHRGDGDGRGGQEQGQRPPVPGAEGRTHWQRAEGQPQTPVQVQAPPPAQQPRVERPDGRREFGGREFGGRGFDDRRAFRGQVAGGGQFAGGGQVPGGGQVQAGGQVRGGGLADFNRGPGNDRARFEREERERRAAFDHDRRGDFDRERRDGQPGFGDRQRDGRPDGFGQQRGGDFRRNDERRPDNGYRRLYGGGYGGGGYGGGDARDYPRGNWDRDWRRDARFNYSAYRAQNRAAYRLPRYYAPAGWNGGYRRFSIGFSLNSVLFDQSYWIEDVDYYRLPPAYGPYRWVRYYNDALLVDIRTGYVVDTVYDIFW